MIFAVQSAFPVALGTIRAVVFALAGLRPQSVDVSDRDHPAAPSMAVPTFQRAWRENVRLRPRSTWRL